MSNGTSTGGEGSQPSPGTRAVAVLSQFREALKAGQRPRIEDVLPDWATSDDSALLRGLVTLEVAYRLRHGERPTEEEYRSRFPGQGRAVEEAFRHQAVTPAPRGLGGTPDAPARTPAPESQGAADQLHPLDLAATPYALAVDLGATRSFGDYELQEKITRDELGVVYRARQVSVDRIVALKLIMADGTASDAAVQQFHRDTMAVAALDHPGIVPIFDVGQHEGQHFVSMGFIEGETLAKKKASGGLGLREGVEVIRQVAETIAYAHGKSVLHRNLTPKNVLLNARGRAKVTGFSSTAPLQSEGSQSMQGRIVGTPSYLAPEQARGSRGRAGNGHPRPRCGPVLRFDRPAAVPGRESGRDPSAGTQSRPEAAAAAQSQRPARARSDLPEVPAKAPRRDVTRRPPLWPRTWVDGSGTSGSMCPRRARSSAAGGS